MNWILEQRTFFSALIFIGTLLMKLMFPDSEYATVAILFSLVAIVAIGSIPSLSDHVRPRIDGVVVLILCWLLTAVVIAAAAWEMRGT